MQVVDGLQFLPWSTTESRQAVTFDRTHNIKLILTLIVLDILLEFLESSRECGPIIRTPGLPNVDIARVGDGRNDRAGGVPLPISYLGFLFTHAAIQQGLTRALEDLYERPGLAIPHKHVVRHLVPSATHDVLAVPAESDRVPRCAVDQVLEPVDREEVARLWRDGEDA